MKSKKKRIRIITAICFGIFLFSQTILATVSPAEDGMVDILLHNAEYFQQNDLFADALRTLGWWMISFLRTICITAEQLYLYCFELLTFSTSDSIQNLISSMQPMYHAILLLSITAVGLMLMMFNSKFPNFLRSILLTVAIVTCSFYIISQLNKALYDTETDTGLVTWAIGGNHTVANEVVNANITDLLYADQKEEDGLLGFSKENAENYHYPEMTDEMFDIIRVREVLNYNDEQLSAGGKELLKKRVKVTGNGVFTLGDVSNGWGWNSEGDDDIGNEFYYRYHVNFLICILTLFAFAVVYLVMSFVVERIIINLVIGQILGILYSADLTGSKKTWMILNIMKDGYIALFLTALSIRIYTLFQAWMNNLFVDHNIVNAILLVFLALAIVMGPSVIEKVTGQNIGISGGLGMMYAAKQAIHGAASIPGHLASAGKTLANGFGWAADKAVKPMPGSQTGSSGGGETGLPDHGMPGLPNSPDHPSGGPGGGGNGENHTSAGQKTTADGVEKEHGLDAEMQKMSHETSKQGQYENKIQNMNAIPSSLENDPTEKMMEESKKIEKQPFDKASEVDTAMQKMSEKKPNGEEKGSLKEASAGLDGAMKELSGNREEKAGLNETSVKFDGTMREMERSTSADTKNRENSSFSSEANGSGLEPENKGANPSERAGFREEPSVWQKQSSGGSKMETAGRQTQEPFYPKEKRLDNDLKDTLFEE